MDQENLFLRSQQARVSIIKRSQHRQHTEAFHAFWALLKIKLSEWNDDLDLLQAKELKTQHDHQELQDLKESLQQLRKHCLGSTVCFDDWEVPDLPVADLRLLHNEFSKYFTKWENAKEVIAPKGKFIFQKYREEVAHRKARGIPLSIPHGMQMPSQKTSQSTTILEEGACLQDLSNVSITIDSDGNVFVEGDEHMKISAAALLVRNLQNCILVISKKLVTLHVVQTIETKICTNESMRAIHVTACHKCSINAYAQQLRLHESSDLLCEVEVAAGAILEDCTRLVFVSDSIEVKDFNWLRTGVPSPNFQIRPLPKDEPEYSPSAPVDQQTSTANLREQAKKSTALKYDEGTIESVHSLVQETKSNEDKQPLQHDDDDDDDDEL